MKIQSLTLMLLAFAVALSFSSCTGVQFVPNGGGNGGYHPSARRAPSPDMYRLREEDRRVFAGDQGSFGPFAGMQRPAGSGVYRPNYRPNPRPAYVTPVNNYGNPYGSYVAPPVMEGFYNPNRQYGFGNTVRRSN